MSHKTDNSHSDLDAEAWPFDDAPNTACATTKQILHDGLPVLYVAHDADDGTWQFHYGGTVSMSDALLVGIQTVYRHDPTIAEVADLPLGWQATRTAPGQSWIRQQSPPEQPNER